MTVYESIDECHNVCCAKYGNVYKQELEIIHLTRKLYTWPLFTNLSF